MISYLFDHLVCINILHFILYATLISITRWRRANLTYPAADMLVHLKINIEVIQISGTNNRCHYAWGWVVIFVTNFKFTLCTFSLISHVYFLVPWQHILIEESRLKIMFVVFDFSLFINRDAFCQVRLIDFDLVSAL